MTFKILRFYLLMVVLASCEDLQKVISSDPKEAPGGNPEAEIPSDKDKLEVPDEESNPTAAGPAILTYDAEELNSIRYTGSLLIGLNQTSNLNLTSTAIEISAPLFPNTSVLYNKEGIQYPVLLQDKISTAQTGHRAFEIIRDGCSQISTYSTRIKLENGPTKLTKQEKIDNYTAIAECSYSNFSSKPYFIPKLVDEVDLCAMHLGTGWRMITENDINSFPSDVYTQINSILDDARTGTTFSWSSFYFSMGVYIRDSGGNLKKGSLFPNATNRVGSIAYVQQTGVTDSATNKLEQNAIDGGSTGLTSAPLVVRCIKIH